ncbi:MAG: hypothetical protein K6T83_00275 [Alicyclobacillus sp.]|nr:hypothetical protein [Alicyclobacillus sp.]
MNFMVIGVIVVLAFAVLVVLEQRKQRKKENTGKARSARSLQEFLPIERFHESGVLVVNGRFRRLIHVGDLNLFSMSVEEIRAIRDRFKEMLMHLDNPFQISVQARRANYTDFVNYAEKTVEETAKAYQNPVFFEYASRLIAHLKEEARKPRTDRQNLIVIGVLPRVGGEDERSQLERLEQEQAYVQAGLSGMGLPYKVLEPIEVSEAVQNFWNRERAVSQRYRDAVMQRTHAPRVDGDDEIEAEVVRNVQQT